MTGQSVPPLGPSTPVLVGVGQAAERIDQPGYEARSVQDLAAAAARAALLDCGGDAAAVTAAIDTIAAVRQADISVPGQPAPLGRSDNFPRSVANRLGAAPARAVLEVGGGQSPQHLVNEFAATIAAGGAEAVLLVGAEITSTTRHLAEAPDKPDFTEHVEGSLEDRGHGLGGMVSAYSTLHGLIGAPATYALFENARRARLGLSRDAYARHMGELFAPFTRVAAKNPYASAPVERDASELVTVTEANRRIADPFTRYIVARDQVNQAAAVLLMSVDTATRLGVPPEKWVFLHGHADVRERDVLDRADLSRAPASTLAAQHALEIAGLTTDDITTFDFYSCFPIAVSATAIDGLGLTADDPRGLTLTGGLPFFGGAGNNYSMHAIAETADRVRATPGSYGFVGANGGVLSKYSVGIYSTRAVEWQPDDSAALQEEIDSWPAPGRLRRANGWATIETWTIRYDRSGKRSAVVVGRAEVDGRRFLASVLPEDDEMFAVLDGPQPIGTRVFVRSTSRGNRVTSNRRRMARLLPSAKPALRQRYDDVLVRRDGHLLEVTINRPDQRNSLTPPANDELASIFDAFFADPQLWVAVITGAGDKAFCAGQDLIWAGSGKPLWVPESGFGGLTNRRSMPKPVIAAVNGHALGGGTELALACHLVVAAETAQFALSEVRVGLVAGAGGLVRLPRTVPPKIATELILTGRRMGAGEALAHGLINRVVPAGSALEGARQLAAEILAVSPTSVRTSLQIMEQTRTIADPIEAIDHPMRAMDDLLLSEDKTEGLRAFAEKRPPRWLGR
jgi:acetyl-CoA C-acetyltransferase